MSVPDRTPDHRYRRLVWLTLLAVFLVGFAGCRTSPIKNIERAPIPPNLTEAQIEKAIIRAGGTLGWVMKVERPGLITGTLSLRDHLAQVEIPFTNTWYSIRYQSSSNLKYDAATQKIHSNYNSWIDNLNRAIVVNLATP